MVIGLLGTEFSSSNRGCGALGYSAIELINDVCKKRKEKLDVYAFLYRKDAVSEEWDSNVKVHYVIIQYKKISFWKETLRIFKQCDFVWDFTGGDSFSDIYGMKRFCLNSSLKQLAIWSKTKFVMAPQTIGPFENKFAVAWAKRILKKSAVCFVRDSISEEYVKKNFGVLPLVTTDVAFSLPYKNTMTREDERVYVGFNPSGLLWDGTKVFCTSKHITIDYKEYVKGVFQYLCADEQYVVCLIPHVFVKDELQHGENDWKACCEIKEMFPKVEFVRDFETPMEAKQIISSMDVFVGARMHATIAAFSTGVATIPVSYSRKFEGLYQDLEYPYLIGATHMNTQEAIDKTIEWIKNKEQLTKKVKESAGLVKKRQQVLLDAIEQMCREEK